jgi:hypothetical protein
MIHWAWFVLGTSFITLLINYSIRNGAYPILLPEMIREVHRHRSRMIRSALDQESFDPTNELNSRIGSAQIGVVYENTDMGQTIAKGVRKVSLLP